jgi:hypothetical protein
VDDYRQFVDTSINSMRKGSHTLVPLLQQRLHAPTRPSDLAGTSFGVVLSFAGNVDGDMIPHLISLAERSLCHAGGTRKEIKRVMAVLIEAVQNVIHHGHIDEQGENSVFLTLENTPLGYQLHCGNLMDSFASEELGTRIGDLNNLSHADLRKAYIDVLCQGEQHPERGNAGLGLISIAKRTEGPIEYLVEPHESGLNLVTLTTTIKR